MAECAKELIIFDHLIDYLNSLCDSGSYSWIWNPLICQRVGLVYHGHHFVMLGANIIWSSEIVFAFKIRHLVR